MSRYGIVINTDNCMECYNCYMACKDEHCGFKTAVSAPMPHTGKAWVRIEGEERGNDTRKIKKSNVTIPCMHCQDAPCKKADKNGAVYTRPDGIVIIDPEKAAGQKELVSACPAGAIVWNDEQNLPQKCTMCAHLLDEGYAMPRCVEACPNEALFFGDLDDPNSEVSKLLKKERITRLKALDGVETNVIHLNIPTVFLAGSVYLPEDEVADGAEVRLVSKKTGEARTEKTNYFGDWEFEWLEKGETYSVEINFDGYRKETFEFVADNNCYVGETILKSS